MPAPTPRRIQRKADLEKARKKAGRRELPDKIDLALQARARGRCEVCGDPMPYRCQRHHRKLRAQGGLDELVNLLLIHPACHHTVHMNPRWSVEHGYIVESTRPPASVPVTLHGQRRVRLLRDGTVREIAA